MDNERIELEAEQQPIDLDLIMQTVASGEAEGITPEQILTPEELAAYIEYTGQDRIQQEGHYANLVDALDTHTLARLAQDVVQWVRWDENTRDDWSKRESEGIRALGVSDRKLGGAAFEGASTVVHPLLAEAITQFHARAISEMWPPEGPVKTVVLGDQTQERMAQASRVEQYMNYQYCEQMPGAFEEEDNLLFRLPLSGSCFKKVYFDPLVDALCSRLIEPSDFIVPFSATDLETASRYTHRYREMHNTVLKKIAAGYYAKSDKLSMPTNEVWDYPEVRDEIDSTEGRERANVDNDSRHTILEMYVDLDLQGFEDCCADGSMSGVALPYIVWVNRDDQEVMRVQRNWMPNDEAKSAKVCVAHYRFMPGLGFYGYGLLHLIGGMATSATGALRALLDSAAFSNMQGGYRTRDSRVKGGDVPLAPGEWREVDISAEELSKAFFKVPYGEPSDVLFKLLGYLDERGQKFVGTTDVMTGDANPMAPVGTTLAMIEQGGKTFTAIHRRLHVAHRKEFKILAQLNMEYLPEDGYPYFTKSGDRHIMPSDFDGRVDIIPVSDPSIISSTQRIVQAQSVMTLAEKHPDQLSLKETIKGMLQAMRVPNYEELMKVDGALQQQQAQMAQLEIQIKQAELNKINAETDLVDAQKTEVVIKAMFESIQAANIVATNPLIAPMADSIFKSAGGKDYNGGSLTDGQVAQAMQQQLQQNTSPNFPANPEQAIPEQPQFPIQEPMASPEVGVSSGVETMANEPMH